MVVARQLLGARRRDRRGLSDGRSTSTCDDGIAVITINRPERLQRDRRRALPGAVRGLDRGARRRRRSASRSSPAPASKSFTHRRRPQELRRPRRTASTQMWLTQQRPAAQPRPGGLEAGDRRGQRLLPRRRHDAAAGHRHPRRRRARDLRRWPRSSAASSPATAARSACSRQLPHAIAMEMLLTGEPIDAETAARWGLVNRVVPAERADGRGAWRLRAADRRQRAAGGAGGQGAGGPRSRDADLATGLRFEQFDQPHAAVHRGRRRRARRPSPRSGRRSSRGDERCAGSRPLERRHRRRSRPDLQRPLRAPS